MARTLPLLQLLLLASISCCDCRDDDTGPLDDDSAVTDDDSASSDDDDTTWTTVPEPGPLDVTLYSACSGGVVAAFEAEAIGAPGAGSEGYSTPPQTTLDAVRGSLTAALAGDRAGAEEALAGTGFEVCRGTGGEAGLLLWRPTEAGTGQPRFVLRTSNARPLILGAPHPVFELETLSESVLLFAQLQARALIVAGAHRCANAASSPCEGTTDVCSGDEEAFRDSDMAHVSDSVFQVAHEVLADAFPTDWALGIHGMEADGISVSDGTEEASSDDAAAAVIGSALMAQFPEEQVTSCNEWSGAVVEDRYCGEFNVQGRYVNGSTFPCSIQAPGSSGRFVHIEQSQAVREQAASVAQAIETALQ